jgi:predicted Rossmann fold nucleotide-binding protein DprA/Smf involved in DNA uptake
VVAGVAELIEDLELLQGEDSGTPAPDHRRSVAVVAALSPPQRAVARALAAGRGSVDELVAATGQPGATVLGVLTALEVRGLAVETFGRYRASGALAASGSGAAARTRMQALLEDPAGG